MAQIEERRNEKPFQRENKRWWKSRENWKKTKQKHKDQENNKENERKLKKWNIFDNWWFIDLINYVYDIKCKKVRIQWNDFIKFYKIVIILRQ